MSHSSRCGKSGGAYTVVLRYDCLQRQLGSRALQVKSVDTSAMKGSLKRIGPVYAENTGSWKIILVRRISCCAIQHVDIQREHARGERKRRKLYTVLFSFQKNMALYTQLGKEEETFTVLFLQMMMYAITGQR